MWRGGPLRVDLRSDTLTRPGAAMREAMATAEVGDDVYGEDPTLRALEERVAELLGHEAGLFTPSGSMANQLGVRLHVEPGEELVGDSLAHVVRAELGAAAVLSGISSRTWVSERGRFRAEDAASLMITGVGPTRCAPPSWSSRTPTTSVAAPSSRSRRSAARVR